MDRNKDLIELKYFSAISKELNLSNLSQITDAALVMNKSKDITGILFFDYGYFGQILEGHRADVEETFKRIQNDKRHQNINLLGLSNIKQRRFPEWSMKLFNAEEFAHQFPQFSEIMNGLNDVDIETYQMIKKIWTRI